MVDVFGERSDPFLRTVLDYYSAVDGDDVPGLLALFSPAAQYCRPGYEPLVGTDALRAFYGGVRVIAAGAHEVQRAVVSEGAVAVQGRFRGEAKSGATLDLGFADFFQGRRLIIMRQTYFYTPLV